MIRTKKFFYRFFHLATPYFNLSIWMMCLEYIMWSYGYDGPCQWQTQLNNKIENERKFIWDPLSCCTLTKKQEEKKNNKVIRLCIRTCVCFASDWIFSFFNVFFEPSCPTNIIESFWLLYASIHMAPSYIHLLSTFIINTKQSENWTNELHTAQVERRRIGESYIWNWASIAWII